MPGRGGDDVGVVGVVEAVGRLDEPTARRLLVDAADAHEDVAGAVRLAAASPEKRVRVLAGEVDRGLRTRRHLDYWASTSWAAEAAPVVDCLENEVADGSTPELVRLLERAAGHLVKVILRADDSNGLIGDLARRVIELHQRACAVAAPDPVALAKWIVRFSFDDQDFFQIDPVAYLGALGDRGLDAYRREVTKRSGPTDVTPLVRDLWAPYPSFAARYAAERLAVVDRDVDRVVELLGRDLTSPHQFLAVAEAMVELDRRDDALAWARRGIAETTGWQVAKLYDLTAALLGDRADGVGVLALRQDQHERTPSSTTYALYQAAARAVGRWEDLQADARSTLAERDPVGLVEALLADGEPAEAWTTADDRALELPGSLWRRLAEANEADNPAGAMSVYLRLADDALVDTGKGAYRDGVRHLKAARRAASAADLDFSFDAKVTDLREQHRRRPTLIAMLDKAGLR